MRILAVEDNQDLASLLKSILEDEGYVMSLPMDGREGYAAFPLFKPDLSLHMYRCLDRIAWN